MAEVDGRVAHGLAGKMVRDRVDLQPVPVQDLLPRGEVGVVLVGALEVEVIAGGGDLQPVIAPGGGEPGHLLEGQVGPLPGEQGDGV